MRTLIQQVDRLQRLAVFEAAARLGSFTAAAGELGLSQPSVTRQVRALEHSIGIELFRRSSNRSQLSDAGRQLLAAVDTGFGSIETILDRLTTANDVLVLAAPPGFAQQLIVPRLDTFHDVLPDCDLRLWIYDRDDELAAGNFDLAVRIGAGHWPGYEAIELFGECAVPVAAPALAEAFGLDAMSTPEQIIAAPLLHMDADGRPWLSWTDWLGAFGLELTAGRRRVVLNNYPTVLQQAVAGRGVALGWRGIVDSMLADGLLVELGGEVRSDRAYCVSWADRRLGTGAVGRDFDARRTAVTWLVELVS
jgi:LysR family transcriptional regulator, glycine cleavage system transcriptional activator